MTNTTTKGFGNLHSKSVNKTKISKQLKDKHISLEKHQHREMVTKTQAGFYISGSNHQNGRVIPEKS